MNVRERVFMLTLVYHMKQACDCRFAIIVAVAHISLWTLEQENEVASPSARQTNR